MAKSALKISLDKKALERIKDICTGKYKFNKSLYISIIESLEEYIIKSGGTPGFSVDTEEFE